MGINRYICAGPSLDVVAISICQAFPRAISFRWKLDINPAMPIPAEHPMVFSAERDDLFSVDRYGNTPVSSEVPQRSSMTTMSVDGCTTVFATSAFGVAPSNSISQTPQIGPANPNDKPNVPPTPGFCSTYRDGTGAGDALYNLCMGFPNNPWSNCVRGKLLNRIRPCNFILSRERLLMLKCGYE